MKKERLYKATLNLDVMFISDTEAEISLEKEAKSFLREEEKNRHPGRFILVEVTDLSDVPKGWLDVNLWGTRDDQDLSARQFLDTRAKEEDPEYEEYMRLKAKFEDADE